MYDTNFNRTTFLSYDIAAGEGWQTRDQRHSFLREIRRAGGTVDEICAPTLHSYPNFRDRAALFSSRSAFVGKPNPNEDTLNLHSDVLKKNGFRVHLARCSSLLSGDIRPLGPGQGLFIGIGYETTLSGAYDFGQFLEEAVTPLELKDPHLNRLDLAMNLVQISSGVIVFACREVFSARAWQQIHRHPSVREVVAIPSVEAQALALSWVEVGTTVLMGVEAPQTSMALRALGKYVLVSELSELRAGGLGAGSLVSPIYAGYENLFSEAAEVRDSKIETVNSSVDWI